MCALLLVVAVLTGIQVFASTIVLTTEHHYVARSDRSAMAVVFADERLIANVKLDVYELPQMRSTSLHYAELAKLSERTWLNALQWNLTDSEGHEIALPQPVVVRSGVRHRGPNAARATDRDTTVECTTYEARLDFGRVPSGDAILRVAVDGLDSSFPVAVRSGQEPEVRDAYLETKAAKATSFKEYRDLQMERYRNDPTRIEPIFNALDRALLSGSIDDARTLLSLGIDRMEARRKVSAPSEAAFFEKRLRELRQVEQILPGYFAHRSEWILARDMQKGGFVLKDRASGTVLKDLSAADR